MTDNLYRCETCGYETRAVISAVALERPRCDAHGEMVWIPEAPAHVGHLGWEYESDDGTVHVINSFADARRIEAASAHRAANEEGASPVVFRALSNDRSNRDVHVFEGQGQNPPSVAELRRQHAERSRARISTGVLESGDLREG